MLALILVFAFLCAALIDGPPLASAQTLIRNEARPQQAGVPSMTGQVLDSLAKPISKATVKVFLAHAASALSAAETVTDDAGCFSFPSLPSGVYTVAAEKPGLIGRRLGVVVSSGAPQAVTLVLKEGTHEAMTAAMPTPAANMEFSDKPDFTVAGVTDWTAVGGHGSDATLRTSEDLARQAATLKPQGTSDSASDSSRTGVRDATIDKSREESREESRLRAALVSAPASYAANHALGEYYLHRASYQRAIPLFEAASTINHGRAEDEYDLALACEGIGDIKKAQQHVEHALGQEEKADFHRLAGRLDEKLGDPLNAVRQQEAAARQDPSEENYFAWGSELLLHRAVWQAAEVFRYGAGAHPESGRMRSAWGAALFAGALYDEAAQRLCEASDLGPADTEPYLLLGKIELAAPTPLPCIKEKLARFVHLRPGSAAAHYLYAMSIYKQESAPDLPLVESLLTEAVALDPKCAEAYLQLGILSSAKSDDSGSITFLTKAVEANPELAEAHYRLGVVYGRIGERVKGERELQLHDALLAAQAATVEKQRREVKQFSVLLQSPQASPHRE